MEQLLRRVTVLEWTQTVPDSLSRATSYTWRSGFSLTLNVIVCPFVFAVGWFSVGNPIQRGCPSVRLPSFQNPWTFIYGLQSILVLWQCVVKEGGSGSQHGSMKNLEHAWQHCFFRTKLLFCQLDSQKGQDSLQKQHTIDHQITWGPPCCSWRAAYLVCFLLFSSFCATYIVHENRFP